MSSTSKRWWALGLIALAQFMVIMDTSIIGVALPRIQADLGFSPENLSWVFNAYVVAFGGLLLLGGRLSDLVGAKRMFGAGWVVLAVGSLGAGLADGVGLEIAARAVQGAGAALITTLAFALVSTAYGPDRRAKALGIFFAVTGLAVASGPLIGGAIAEGLRRSGLYLIDARVSPSTPTEPYAKVHFGRESHAPLLRPVA